MEMQYSDGSRIFSDVRHFDLDIDNQTLVDECRSGDRDAMSILYTRFAPRMLHLISRYVSDRDTAHDILHDGFVAAFTRLDTLRDSERLDFWLATIMKNLSLKYLQAQTVASILNEIPDTPDEPELDDILDFATIESLIRQLPEGYQKVFRLAVLEGKSHKEISKILGIAPNSSSSQLFHAKIRLRQLIRDYQLRTGLISFLLLIVSASALFFSRYDNDSMPADNLAVEAIPQQPDIKPIVDSDSTIPSAPKTPVTPPASTAPVGNRGTLFATTSAATISNIRIITASDSSETEQPSEETSITPSPIAAPVDSIVQPPAYRMPEVKPEDPYMPEQYADVDLFLAEAVIPAKRNKGWSMSISVDPGLASFDGFGSGDAYGIEQIRPGLSQGPNQDPCDTPDETEPSGPERAPQFISLSSAEDYLSSHYFYRRHYLPVSFALTAEKQFSSWLGIESGIGYSYLHTDFERSELHSNEVSTCHWHYLEVPLKVNLYAYSSSRFRIYGSLGWKVAVPIYSYASMAPNSVCPSGRFGSKPVWSVGVSVGMAYRLSKRVDLFIEPSLRYHFPQDAAIPNIWTDDTPWSFSLPLGFRFNW